MRDSAFAMVALGREICDAGDLARHRHDCGYMTLVLSGGMSRRATPAGSRSAKATC